MDFKDFIGEKVQYRSGGTHIIGIRPDGSVQNLVDISIRGWGAIQNLFMGKKGAIDFDSAEKFQDSVGEFIADAINEKLERERAEQS